YCFFFSSRRRHTRFSRDWSSDVCSSDLGLIGDTKLAELMREQLADLRIENLERTFVGVATELTTGHELWLHKGDLTQAIRASYRSEERRVGKERRSRCAPQHDKLKSERS